MHRMNASILSTGSQLGVAGKKPEVSDSGKTTEVAKRNQRQEDS